MHTLPLLDAPAAYIASGSDYANSDPQKLQRRIADARGIASVASLVSPTAQLATEELKLQDVIKPEAPAPDGRETVGVIVTKRKYRRHPKVGFCDPSSPRKDGGCQRS
jgi:hypothetical protein